MNRDESEQFRQSLNRCYSNAELKEWKAFDVFDGQYGTFEGQRGFSLEEFLCSVGYPETALPLVVSGEGMALGCGNPVAHANLKPGESVVDLGCGGGLDCLLSSMEVGEAGKVIGIDMSKDMVECAWDNASLLARYDNLEFRVGSIEDPPVESGIADAVLANCVISLSADRDCVYRQVYRILKSRGRLIAFDFVSTCAVSRAIRKEGDRGRFEIAIDNAEEVAGRLEKAGFINVTVELCGAEACLPANGGGNRLASPALVRGWKP